METNEEEIAISYITTVGNEKFVSTFDDTNNIQSSEKYDTSEESLAAADLKMSDFMENESFSDVSNLEKLQVDKDTESNEQSFVDRLTCGICDKKYTSMSNKLRHVRKVHNGDILLSSLVKCIECNITFGTISKLRAHLASEHKLEMGEQELRFPSMEDFMKWKCEIERRTLSSYTLRNGVRKSLQGLKYFYTCRRTGKYSPKVDGSRQRLMKTQESCKMGIFCTAGISVQIHETHVSVIYCPNHYGHGKDTTLLHLTSQEQSAIAESVSKGEKYEKLLDDIRDSQSSKDHFPLHLLKKKDFQSINNSFKFQDFNIEMSDAESVDQWVNSCCQMENSPILCYKKDCSTKKEKKEEFLLIIMTEFQKHILLSSNKNVICVDSLYRKKGLRFYLTVLFIMDENELAFPVAFCISDKVDKNVIKLFFQSLYASAGLLEYNYFMSDSESFYYEAWREVMGGESKWLWSLWYVDNRFRVQLRVLRGDISKRAAAYKTMRTLLECQNQTVFQCMFENFIESLEKDPDSKDLSTTVKEYYASCPEIWAHCFRKNIDLSTNIHLEIMHRVFRYCCCQGRKKRLDKFIFTIMKLVRDKMLDRLTNMRDNDKVELALETIKGCHVLGLDISPQRIVVLADKTWLIHGGSEEDDNYYVVLENPTCPEHCSLKCFECDICVHMYTCSCVHNLINANLCQHVHAVVWNLLNPHLSPPPPGSPLDVYDETPDASSEFFQKLLEKTQKVYEQIEANKGEFNMVALNSLMKHMDECMEICNVKVLDENEASTTTAPSTTSTTTINSTFTNSPGTVLLFNPIQMKAVNNQQIVLSNPVSDVNSNSAPQSSYVFILPSPNTVGKSELEN